MERAHDGVQEDVPVAPRQRSRQIVEQLVAMFDRFLDMDACPDYMQPAWTINGPHDVEFAALFHSPHLLADDRETLLARILGIYYDHNFVDMDMNERWRSRLGGRPGLRRPSASRLLAFMLGDAAVDVNALVGNNEPVACAVWEFAGSYEPAICDADFGEINVNTGSCLRNVIKKLLLARTDLDMRLLQDNERLTMGLLVDMKRGMHDAELMSAFLAHPNLDMEHALNGGVALLNVCVAYKLALGVKLLVERGANPNIRAHYKARVAPTETTSAIQFALRSSSSDVLKEVLAYPAADVGMERIDVGKIGNDQSRRMLLKHETIDVHRIIFGHS